MKNELRNERNDIVASLLHCIDRSAVGEAIKGCLRVAEAVKEERQIAVIIEQIRCCFPVKPSFLISAIARNWEISSVVEAAELSGYRTEKLMV
jgi:hypothetical protein